MPERLEIGVADYHGPGEGAYCETVVNDLVERCLRVDYRRLPVRALLLLATPDWCNPSDSLSKHIRWLVESHLGYPVPLIGTSMPVIYCSTAPTPLIEKGLVLVAVCSNDLWMTVGALPRPHERTQEERKQRLREMADRLEKAAKPRLGASAQRDLFGFLPGVFADKGGMRAYLDNELHREILEVFGHRYCLYGGAAADGIVPKKGYQFANDECLESGLTLAIVESDLSIGLATGHGFVPIREEPLSVDRFVGDAQSGYDVALIDGRPAKERVRNIAAQALQKDSRIVLGVPNGPDFDVFVPLDISSEAGTIRLGRRVSRGDRLYLLGASPELMFEAEKSLFKRVQDNANSPDFNDIGLILIISSTGRSQLFQEHRITWQAALQELRNDYPGVPTVGGLCAGEFGVNAWHQARASNMGVSLCCVANRLCHRARTRELQEELLDAIGRVSACRDRDEVMRTALEGAVGAGAEGGQVCIVDWTIGRIIGRHLGCAFRAPGSGHNWPAVQALTDREPPSPAIVGTCGGCLPPGVRDWAVWIKPAVAHAGPCNMPELEDILTLIVRTGVALFVPDSRLPAFCCDQMAIDACVGPLPNTLAQLAIPLIGSNGRAIATFQVSFPDGTILDRESMRLWVGYGQKVAAALERAQEAEERAVKEKISSVANCILKEPVNTRLTSYEWTEEVCQPYVVAVRKLLGASGTHMRVRCAGLEGDEYRLVASDGDLDSLRQLTRPVVRVGAGSLRQEVLGKTGRITNIREETRKLNEEVVPLIGEYRYREAFMRELQELECTAMIPIHEGTHLSGSFVIESKQKYFFTEQRVRIVRFAAEMAGALLRERGGAYDRAVLEGERDRIIKTLTATSGSETNRSLREVLKSLCEATGANVGSVYLWHEEALRLILYVAHNWYRGQDAEGCAWYALGEGWTGSLGFPQGEVIQLVDPTSIAVPSGIRKYYDWMIPVQHKVPGGSGDARVGIRLAVGEKLLGVVTLTYWRGTTDHLVKGKLEIRRLTKALTPLLVLAVQAAQQDIARHERAALAEAEQTTAEAIIGAARPDGDWQSVVDTIREKFRVERVTSYRLVERRLQYDQSSVISTVEFKSPFIAPAEPSGPMRDVVFGSNGIAVGPRNAHLFAQWPSLTDARGALLVPVVGTSGEVLGVLEFVNRIPDRDHPFEAFDLYEQKAATDVARAVGAGMGHLSHEIAESELRAQLATAMRIGAASIGAAIVMHQLLTPFARIQQAVEWVRLNKDASDEEFAERLNRIEDACSEAVKTIHEAAGRGTLASRRENIREIVGEAVRVIRSDVPIVGVSLSVTNTVDALVRVDVLSVVGAIVSLLTNAVDAIGGSGTLAVSTELAQRQERVTIRIRNTGPEVTPAQIARFFAPGYTSKNKKEHLGLGLSVACQAIEMSGGDIHMVPWPEGGLETIISFPVVEDSSGEAEEPSTGDDP